MKKMRVALALVVSAFIACFTQAANVAKVGNTEYATIGAAIDAVQNGETIELLSDITVSGYFVYNKSFTIDGKGKTITCASANTNYPNYFVNVANGYAQTFKNVTINANEKVPYAIQCIGSTSKLILDNVTIKGGKSMKTKGKNDSYSKQRLGYGIHVNQGTVEAKDLTVTNCTVLPVYLDGASSSMSLSGDKCNLDLIGTAGLDETVSSSAKGFYAYEVTASYTFIWTFTKEVRVISSLPWNEVISKVGDYTEFSVQNATVKLLQDVVLSETFTSNNTKLTIEGNNKVITGTIKFTTSPSTIKNAVLGEGTTLDCTASTTTGFSSVSVAANATIDILLPASTDISKYSLPVSLGANAIANITVGDKKYIAKGDVITPAETLAQVGDKQYATLQAAIDAANGATIHVLKDVALTASLNIPAGKTLTLNLAGRKVTITGADYALINNGTLTIIDQALVAVVEETSAQNDDVVSFLITCAAANDGVVALDDATGGSIAGVQNKGTFALESGAVVAASASVPAIDNTANAVATITGGTVNGKLQSVDKSALTVTGGSFTGNSNVSDFVGGNYGVDDNGTVISYVAQLGATKYQTLQEAFAAAKEFDVVTVLDAEADVSGIAGYVAEGLFPISNGDKTYTLRAMPAATVEKLPAFTLTKARDAYACWPEGDTAIDRPLDIVMNFLANDDGKAEANETGFADWKCDFYLTFSGMAGASLEADDCYLAGNYGGFGWIVIPADDTIIDNNATLPVVAAYDANITYRQVCDTVKKFTAAIHVADAVMTANPNLKITLQLKMTNNKDASQELVVGSYTYTIDDLKGEFNPAVKVEDGATVTDTFKATVGSGLANAYQATEGKLEVTVVEQAETFATLDVSATDGYEVPAEGLEMTFPAQSVNDNEPAIIVHKHEGKYYVTTGLVEYGFVTYNNTLGFSEFIVGDVAALNAALAEGGEVILSSDIVLNETLTIPAGKTVTLDLNGKAITVPEAESKHIYALKNLGNLTLKDSVGGGSITARGIFNGADNNNTATMVVESGNYYSQDSDGGAAIFNYAVLTVNGGNFGGYIALNTRPGSEMTINGGTFGCNSAGSYAIQNNGGELTINDATVNSGFGAVGCYGGTTVINNGTFMPTGRKASTCHVVYVAGSADVTINGGTFKMSYSADAVPDSGSAVASYYNGKLAINGGTFYAHFDTVSPVELSTGSEITGGMYYNHSGVASNHSYVKNFVKEGYELKADGQVVVKLVAQIGEVGYATLQAALEAAQAGETIVVADNFDLGAITVDKQVTLDLNGKVITATGSYFFYLLPNAELTIKDSSETKSGTLKGVNADGTAGVGNAFLVYEGSTLKIESGIIHAYNNVICTYGEGIVVNISGGELRSFLQDPAGAPLYLAGTQSEVTLSGGTFIGPIYNWNDKLSISGGQFTVDVTSYCAPGYKAQKNTATGYYEVVEDRVETVDPSVAQAKIALGGEDKYYATLADAVKAAQNESVTDLVITLMGTTSATTAVSFNLSYKTVFNSVTFKQADATQPYFIEELYTGARVNDGAFIFDGVNIAIPSNGQYMFEGNVKLINNSTITSTAEANCFVYYADVTIEPGSKLNGVIDDIRGGTLTVDGGKTDGTYSATPDMQDAMLHVNWADSKLVVKNGAYVKVNSVNEIGRLTINGAVEVTDAKLEAYEYIAIAENATMTVDSESEITTGKLTGKGKLTIDATNFASSTKTLIKANASEFTGTIEVVGNDLVSYEKTSEGIVIKASLAGAGTEAEPYQISKLAELELFRDSVNKGETKYNAPGVYVALADDIDGITWERGIGDGINATYDGIFDGKGYTIKNVTLAPTADSDKYFCGGLFGYTYGAAVIKNLTIENITVTANGEGHNVGALVGFAYNKGGKLNVFGVTVKDVTITAPNAYGVGAIVGYSYGSMGTIEKCSVDGTTITGYSFVGGITGYSYNNATITDCSVENVTITATSKFVGGIAGIVLDKTTITDCTVAATTTINGTACAGAIVGAISGNGNTLTLENCTATGSLPEIGGNYSDDATVVAKVGNKYYASFTAAFSAAQAGDTITLLKPIVVKAGEELNLNKAVTITYTSAVPGEDMITNKGTLIVDGASLIYTNTDATASNVTVATISSEPGSVLEIKSGLVQNDSPNNGAKGIYAYTVDLLTNGAMGDVTATISGGKVVSTNYMAIRQFNNGTQCKNTLTITDGEITAAKRAIQIHMDNNAAYTTISGGTITAGEGGYALCFFPTTAEHISVTGGTFTGMIYSGTEEIIFGGTFAEEPYAGYIAAGYACTQNDDGTYTVADDPATHFIASLDDLIAFREDVNNGYDYEGVTVYLTADIDMASVDWSVNIGDAADYSFNGTFDGQNHKILNLNSTETAQDPYGYICTGLFGCIAGDASIQNLILENVTINTGSFTGNNVAALVGFAWSCTGTIDNVTVKNVTINATKATGVGAIVGYDYYSPTLTIQNCTVDGTTINGASYVGGVIGYASSKITLDGNTVKNVSISAKGSVGGIAGIMLSGGIALDNTVTNVTLTATGELWANSVGAVAGTMTNGSIMVAGTTVTGGNVADIVGGILVEKPTAPIVKVQAQIGDMYYTTVETALDDAPDGTKVTVMNREAAVAFGEKLVATGDKEGAAAYEVATLLGGSFEKDGDKLVYEYAFGVANVAYVADAEKPYQLTIAIKDADSTVARTLTGRTLVLCMVVEGDESTPDVITEIKKINPVFTVAADGQVTFDVLVNLPEAGEGKATYFTVKVTDEE